MKKLTTSVLAVVLTASFSLMNAQKDTIKTESIEEVIITGALGIKKKADAITSSQEVVTAEKLNQAGNPNVVEALSGKVSGLQINQTNSSVNSSNTIQLRGSRSITGNNQALVIIDGAISSASVLQQLPADVVESVNVIKGAQGSALYGSDGVNGVIIVTTKQGTKRGLNVTYNGTVDFQTAYRLPLRQTTYGQGWDGDRDAYENGAWGPAFNGEGTVYGIPQWDADGDGLISLDNWAHGINYRDGDVPAQMFLPYSARPDNVKKFFKVGNVFGNDITINTGSEGKYAMLNLSNVRRNFVVKDDVADRTSVLFKAGGKINRWTIEGSFNYIRNKVSQTNSGLYYNLLQSSTDAPITEYEQFPDNAYAWNAYYNNPYWTIKHNRYDDLSNFFNATAALGFEVNENINVRYTGNLQNTNNTSLDIRDDWFNDKASDLTSVSSFLRQTQSNTLNYYGDLLLNFNYDLNDDWGLDFTLGNNYQDRKYNVTTAGGTNLDIPGLYTVYNVKKPYQPSSLANGRYRRNSFAFFGNLDVNYKNYLFINATGRNEWSSVLPKANNSYFYPSVGVSFVPTKAWQNFGGNTLNYLKIAASWARVGNSSSVGWYDINSVGVVASGFPYSSTGPTQGALNFISETSPTDTNIRPEFVTSKEVNLELGFFKDRLRLKGSIFQQDTDDMITWQSASRASGINNKLINIGEMQTKGIEIDLGITPFRTRDYQLDFDFSYYNAQSKVIKVTDDTDEIALQAFRDVGIYAKAGYLFPLIKVNMMTRDDQGRIVVDAVTGEPIYTPTLVEGGTTQPKHIFGLNTSLKIKNFRLGAVLDYRTGHKFFGDVATGLAFNGTIMESGAFDRTQGGFIMPNSSYQDANGNYVANTSVKTGGTSYADVLYYYSNIYNRIGENFLFDASAFKIREVSVSYSVPNQLFSNTNINDITFTVHARNPFIKYAKDNLNYADPETSNTSGNAKGIASSGQYPTLRTFGFGLNVKF